jgi:hypothetical protein
VARNPIHVTDLDGPGLLAIAPVTPQSVCQAIAERSAAEDLDLVIVRQAAGDRGKERAQSFVPAPLGVVLAAARPPVPNNRIVAHVRRGVDVLRQVGRDPFAHHTPAPTENPRSGAVDPHEREAPIAASH